VEITFGPPSRPTFSVKLHRTVSLALSNSNQVTAGTTKQLAITDLTDIT